MRWLGTGGRAGSEDYQGEKKDAKRIPEHQKFPINRMESPEETGDAELGKQHPWRQERNFRVLDKID